MFPLEGYGEKSFHGPEKQLKGLSTGFACRWPCSIHSTIPTWSHKHSQEQTVYQD